jgi:hypothetical protein
MLHLFHMDVAEVDRGMLHMLQLSQRHVASVCFECFQKYVSSVFSERMLRVCLSGCPICFTHMLHVFLFRCCIWL